MTVIARDQVAADHLVYAWPFPIGPECEVSCGDDEQVVMCPSWTVGDRLGPGRHHYRTPDPTRPVSAFFVLTAAVEASFDMTTMFLIPTTGQPVRLRAIGSLQVQCQDPGLLIAQFVGLPFDSVNESILRSVSRSVERMLARLLTRRVVMMGTPIAVIDPKMLPGIIEELVAYNPTAGAVFGIELIRMGHLAIAADDGSTPQIAMPGHNVDWSGGVPRAPANGDGHASQSDPHPDSARSSQPDIPLLETARGRPGPDVPSKATMRHASVPPSNDKLAASSGEILVRSKPGAPAATPEQRRRDDITQPNLASPVPGTMQLQHTPHTPHTLPPAPAPAPAPGGILGIGVSHIGSGPSSGVVVSGEIPGKIAPGGRVLVPGPNGLMQSATVRQQLQGYYELEVGSSGETIWVPINGVVPES